MKEVRLLTPEETEVYNCYYHQYYEMILGIARTRVGDDNIAEVVAQETFVTAWEKYDSFQGCGNPPGWLVIVAKNKSKQALRERKQYLDHVIYGKSVNDIPVENDFTQIESEIPESKEKELLTKYYEEGYTIQELADAQNLKLSAMKMRIKRARDRLKEKILQNN